MSISYVIYQQLLVSIITLLSRGYFKCQIAYDKILYIMKLVKITEIAKSKSLKLNIGNFNRNDIMF